MKISHFQLFLLTQSFLIDILFSQNPWGNELMSTLPW